MAGNGLVIDDFSCTPASFDGLVSVTLSNVSGPVSFFTAAFFPDTSSEIDFSNLSNDPSATCRLRNDRAIELPAAARLRTTLRPIQHRLPNR